jgi:hypothetical protein
VCNTYHPLNAQYRWPHARLSPAAAQYTPCRLKATKVAMHIVHVLLLNNDQFKCKLLEVWRIWLGLPVIVNAILFATSNEQDTFVSNRFAAMTSKYLSEQHTYLINLP